MEFDAKMDAKIGEKVYGWNLFGQHDAEFLSF